MWLERLALTTICGLAASAAVELWYTELFQRWREPLQTRLEQHYLGVPVRLWWLIKALVCPFCLTFHLTALFLLLATIWPPVAWVLLWLAGGRIGVAAGRFLSPQTANQDEEEDLTL